MTAGDNTEKKGVFNDKKTLIGLGDKNHDVEKAFKKGWKTEECSKLVRLDVHELRLSGYAALTRPTDSIMVRAVDVSRRSHKSVVIQAAKQKVFSPRLCVFAVQLHSA